MKRLIIAVLCAAPAIIASSQQNVVKEAEKAMKANKDYVEVLNIIKPAMSNPETAKSSTTYFIPGQAGFNQYDRMYGMQQLGRLNDGDEVKMSDALLGGYDNFIIALSLDTVVDAKGKVKTQHSKKIVDNLKGHYNDFTQAGINFYNAKQFEKAYKAWEAFVTLSDNAAKYGIEAQPDTVVANFILNEGLAAWQMNDADLAAKTFRRAAERGYDKEQVYQYGLSTALAANNPDVLYYFAIKGNEKYGETDNQYVNSLINYYLQNKKYDDAIKYLDDAISKRPGDAQYYALKGIILEDQEDMPQAMEYYKKAVELNPENGLANYYYGRGIAIETGNKSDAFPGEAAEYQNFFNKELKPQYEESVRLLEAAYTQDANNRANILNLLEQIYYILNDEAGMESVKSRRLDD
ncbi:MAG: tetratricopeptide repeat protein [Muribaculaceae bacterium]|nr:tetratricopeptide repeat protein [Muribaculaceae bacterium]